MKPELPREAQRTCKCSPKRYFPVSWICSKVPSLTIVLSRAILVRNVASFISDFEARHDSKDDALIT